LYLTRLNYNNVMISYTRYLMHVFADQVRGRRIVVTCSTDAAVLLTTQGCLQEMFSQLLLLVLSCRFVWAILLRVPQVCLVTRKTQSAAAASAVMKAQEDANGPQYRSNMTFKAVSLHHAQHLQCGTGTSRR
jgi:hypothetical protein